MPNLFGKSKSVEEVVCCVVDYGTFLSLAEKLAETMKTVYYYSPFEEEYQDIRECMTGTGLKKVKRLDDFFDPEVFDTIDLFVFPDIGYGGLQRHLRAMGKSVWGSMGASELELYRTKFIDVLKKVGLPVIPSKKIKGLTALKEYLKEHDDQWVKINRYRRNMETWHHLDFDHSQRMLESMAVVFGPVKDEIEFVVQENLHSDMETGYDGWCVDGSFPSKSFQGYEKKNELYLGSVASNKNLPEEIKYVNEKMAPILEEYGYRNWWATEIRVADKKPYFIDPTARMPGQTGEHQLETCTNLAEVIWKGSNGELITPKFEWKFAAEATLHYDAMMDDMAVLREWKTIRFPDHILRWVKPYHYLKLDGLYHCTPEKTDEVGVLIGVGNSLEESIDHLMENLEELKEVPVHANIAGFTSLIESIKEAEDQGIKFGGDIPEPEEIMKDIGKIL